MLELELFFKRVEAKLREEHCEYLEKLKREPLPSSEKGFFKKLFRRRKIAVEDKILKSYNKGIHRALKVLQSEYKAFLSRMSDEDYRGKKH